MVAKADAFVEYQGRRFGLTATSFADGTLATRGFELLSDFRLERGFAHLDVRHRGRSADAAHLDGAGPQHHLRELHTRPGRTAADIGARAAVHLSDYHAHTHGGWPLAVTALEHGCAITAFPGAQPYRVVLDRGQFSAGPDWYWRFQHRAEAQRGLDTLEDLFRPGALHAEVAPGDTVT